MIDDRSEDTLMALLALDAEGQSGEPGAGLPKLDDRIAMYVAGVGGSTAEPDAMRAAARDHLLDAMAADLVAATSSLKPRAANRHVPLTSARLAAVAAKPVSRIPAPVSSEASDGFFAGFQRFIESASAPFTVRRLSMAAVPLVALLVAGSFWNETWLSGSGPSDQGSSSATPTTRSIGPQQADTAAEQSLQGAIAADEASHGRSAPSVALKLVDLASLYLADGRYKEAQALCERALIIQDQAFGPKSAESIGTVKVLAAIYRAEGRGKDADQLLARAKQP